MTLDGKFGSRSRAAMLLGAALVAAALVSLWLSARPSPAPEADRLGASVSRPTLQPSAGPAKRGDERTEALPRDEGSVRGTLRILPAEDRRSVVTLEIRESGRAVGTAPIAAGPFEFAYPRGAGAHVATIHAVGARTQQWALPDRRTDLGEVVLASSAAYGGRVLDVAGRPVRGVRVKMWDGNRVRVGESADSDESGRYRIDVEVSPVLSCDANGHSLNYVLTLEKGLLTIGPVPAESRGWVAAHDVTYSPEPPPRLRFAHAPGGAPVVGAVATFHPGIAEVGRASRLPPVFQATSNASGELEYPRFPLLHCCLIDIRDPNGVQYVHTLDLETAAYPVEEVVLSAERNRTLHARVRWASDGKPVPGARIWILGNWSEPPARQDGEEPEFPPGPPGPAFRLQGTANSDGNLSWTVVPPGTGELELSPRFWSAEYEVKGMLETEMAAIARGEDAARDGVDVLLQGRASEPWWFLVDVRDESSGASGAPVGGVLEMQAVEGGPRTMPIRFGGSPLPVIGGPLAWQCFPDPDFVRESARATRIRFLLELSGRPPRWLEADPDEVQAAIRHERPLTLVVPRGTGVATIRVVRPDGSPGAGTVVTVGPSAAGGVAAWVQATRMTAGVDGVAFCGDLEGEVAYAVFAWDPATAVAGFANPLTLDGETLIRLAAPSEATVYLTFSSGKPAWPAWVTLESVPSMLAPPLHASAQRDGTVRLPRCVLALYRAVIVAQDDALGTATNRANQLTHRRVLEGRDLHDGMQIGIPPIEDR